MTQEERQQKFELFVEAMDIPLKVEVYKPTSIFLKVILFMLVCVAVFFVAIQTNNAFLLIFLLIGFILTAIGFTYYQTVLKKHSKKPEIVVDTDGIYTQKAGFWGWTDIHDEHIRHDKNMESYLCYECPNGSVRALLSNYDLDVYAFMSYLKKHRELHYIKKNTFNL